MSFLMQIDGHAEMQRGPRLSWANGAWAGEGVGTRTTPNTVMDYLPKSSHDGCWEGLYTSLHLHPAREN
jgi:hypothetical protein